MSRSEHIRLMARYNEWINAKLYQAAASLPEVEIGAERKAFFGSILGTLNHVMVGDIIWLKRFASHPADSAALDALRALPAPARLDQILDADLGRLWTRRRELDRLIVDWAAAMQESELDHVLSYSNMQGVAARRDFFSLVMHFFNHQTHHRGQVTTLLSQAGVDVGGTDLLAVIADQGQP